MRKKHPPAQTITEKVSPHTPNLNAGAKTSDSGRLKSCQWITTWRFSLFKGHEAIFPPDPPHFNVEVVVGGACRVVKKLPVNIEIGGRGGTQVKHEFPLSMYLTKTFFEELATFMTSTV